MKWMQGRLYWQSFAIVSMLGGHYYYSMKHMEKLEIKRAQYERERDIVCQNAHISPELGLEFRVTGVLREKEALLTQQKICGG